MTSEWSRLLFSHSLSGAGGEDTRLPALHLLSSITRSSVTNIYIFQDQGKLWIWGPVLGKSFHRDPPSRSPELCCPAVYVYGSPAAAGQINCSVCSLKLENSFSKLLGLRCNQPVVISLQTANTTRRGASSENICKTDFILLENNSTVTQLLVKKFCF